MTTMTGRFRHVLRIEVRVEAAVVVEAEAEVALEPPPLRQNQGVSAPVISPTEISSPTGDEQAETDLPWIVLVIAVLAGGCSAYMAMSTKRDWDRLQLTQRAAVALLDVHRDRLDAAAARASALTGELADDGEELAAAIAELRADADHLGWMLSRIPDERERLRRELLDLVLPTERRDG